MRESKPSSLTKNALEDLDRAEGVAQSFLRELALIAIQHSHPNAHAFKANRALSTEFTYAFVTAKEEATERMPIKIELPKGE